MPTASGKPEEPTVKAFRERFSSGPVGYWTSKIQFGPWPHDEWEFIADGDGTIRHYASTGNSLTAFEWRPVSTREIAIRTSYVTTEVPSDSEPDRESVELTWDDSDPWWTLSYDFETLECRGLRVVMFEPPRREHTAFHLTLDPLHLVEPRV